MSIHSKIHMELPMNIHSVIIKFIKKERVVTSSEIAKSLDVSWNTAEKYLLELAVEGKIERIKKLGVNLWLLR
jgi:Mn-dependent DtxR family transcriptional regulator